MEEAKARQQAEEEARRQEAEPKRKAEEEQKRQEAEAEARARDEEASAGNQQKPRYSGSPRRSAGGRRQKPSRRAKKPPTRWSQEYASRSVMEAVGTGRWRVRAAIGAAAIAGTASNRLGRLRILST